MRVDAGNTEKAQCKSFPPAFSLVLFFCLHALSNLNWPFGSLRPTDTAIAVVQIALLHGRLASEERQLTSLHFTLGSAVADVIQFIHQSRLGAKEHHLESHPSATPFHTNSTFDSLYIVVWLFLFSDLTRLSITFRRVPVAAGASADGRIPQTQPLSTQLRVSCSAFKAYHLSSTIFEPT